MTDSAWSELTPPEIVAQFDGYLTRQEQQEIIEFELDPGSTLGMVCATLNENGYDIDTVLQAVGADVSIPGPSY